MDARKVLVTGASGGIGRAIAQRLTDDGYQIINIDLVEPRNPVSGEVWIKADLTNVEEARTALEPLVKSGDVLRIVNNAGFIRPATLENTSIEDFQAVVDLNLRAPILVTQALMPAMRQAKFGRVVNISSRASLGKELRTAYSATKAGMLGMTRTWAMEAAADGVTVNAIGPGPIATELFLSGNPPDSPKTRQIMETIPVKRMGTPEDIAHAVASLIDDRAGYITGQVLYVCGGMTAGISHTA
ncbi:SDR family oxidoreductase [Orrella marina]|uniref:Short-chain dehydrogenase n=1 Tax=Orrella marina TaxID=2163011 RepID=A0A2R4XML0_9BURK|nr:SDR family oxidoreductase [Orrella marina]AWB35042.1 short-chain dehydrogenase [Orrella marina]